MKKLITLAIVFISAWLLWPPASVAAHFLITNGNIGMILHVDPNDDPAVNGNTTIYLDFKDKTSRFSLEKCTCNFVLSKDGQQVYQTLLEQPQSPVSYSLHYVFPAKGVYQLAVKGKPTTAGAFDDFLLQYDVRVARVEGSTTAASDSKVAPWIYGMWTTATLLIVAIVAWNVKRFRAQRKK